MGYFDPFKLIVVVIATIVALLGPYLMLSPEQRNLRRYIVYFLSYVMFPMAVVFLANRIFEFVL